MDKRIFKGRGNRLKSKDAVCSNCHNFFNNMKYYWRCPDCDDKYILCNDCNRREIYNKHQCFIVNNLLYGGIFNVNDDNI
jgi:hypothetical protein